jgi:hypothetical protein
MAPSLRHQKLKNDLLSSIIEFKLGFQNIVSCHRTRSYKKCLMRRNAVMNKGGFSWKRLTGVSAAKSRISRSIGIPLTKSGRQRKIGRMVTGGGCLVVIVIRIIVPASLTVLVYMLI